MIEAWRSVDPDEYRLRNLRGHAFDSDLTQRSALGSPSMTRRVRSVTTFARDLFGNFVPRLNYPSPLEIERELTREIEFAEYRVAAVGQSILSNSFIDAFEALSISESVSNQSPEEILEQIRVLLTRLDESPIIRDRLGTNQDVYGRLRTIVPKLRSQELSDTAASVLSVYRKSLEERIQTQADTFAPIERYIESVNEFLEAKKLAIDFFGDEQRPSRAKAPRVVVKFADSSHAPIRALSSGERQIVSMLYAAWQTAEDSVVLIDEPEISLHIDWQRLLLSKMAQQLSQRQIIVFTHSPEIGADYESRFQEIQPSQTETISGFVDLGRELDHDETDEEFEH